MCFITLFYVIPLVYIVHVIFCKTALVSNLIQYFLYFISAWEGFFMLACCYTDT